MSGAQVTRDTLRLISCAQVDDCTEAEDETLSED